MLTYTQQREHPSSTILLASGSDEALAVQVTVTSKVRRCWEQVRGVVRAAMEDQTHNVHGHRLFDLVMGFLWVAGEAAP
eukprot:6181328-Pleurochrysis_carterae.AAC.1